MENNERLITVAIHTYEKALILKTLLEDEGIPVVINNVNLIQPVVSSGVRVRIKESDLPLALKIIENSAINSGEPVEEKEEIKKNVLIPIDYSDYSKKACEIGFDFANKSGGTVILLNTYILMSNTRSMLPFTTLEENSDIFINDESDEEVVKFAERRMREFCKGIKADIAAGLLPNVKFTDIVTEGIPESTILYCANQSDASLIVMGTRGKSKKEAELIGSVTAEVLDACKYPVFTVPEGMSNTKVSEIKNVVFFSNFVQEDLISFDIFTRLFNNQPMNITIIPIDDKKDENTKKEYLNSLVDYCSEHYKWLTVNSTIIEEKNFAEIFEGFVKENGTDLILVPNKKRNIFARLFNASVAHRMVFHSDVPMLVVPV